MVCEETTMLSIEERVKKLEEAIFQNNSHDVRQKDWRRTVSMFKNDPAMKEIIDEAARMREEERKQARRSDNGASE